MVSLGARLALRLAGRARLLAFAGSLSRHAQLSHSRDGIRCRLRAKADVDDRQLRGQSARDASAAGQTATTMGTIHPAAASTPARRGTPPSRALPRRSAPLRASAAPSTQVSAHVRQLVGTRVRRSRTPSKSCVGGADAATRDTPSRPMARVRARTRTSAAGTVVPSAPAPSPSTTLAPDRVASAARGVQPIASARGARARARSNRARCACRRRE